MDKETIAVVDFPIIRKFNSGLIVKRTINPPDNLDTTSTSTPYIGDVMLEERTWNDYGRISRSNDIKT